MKKCGVVNEIKYWFVLSIIFCLDLFSKAQVGKVLDGGAGSIGSCFLFDFLCELDFFISDGPMSPFDKSRFAPSSAAKSRALSVRLRQDNA